MFFRFLLYLRVLFGQAGRGRGVAVVRGRVGGPQARGPVRGGRNPAVSGVRGAQRPTARGGVVRAKGNLPGEDGLYLHNIIFYISLFLNYVKQQFYFDYFLFVFLRFFNPLRNFFPFFF